MKRWGLVLSFVALGAVALPGWAQTFQPSIKPSGSFDGDYSRGSAIPLATTTGPVRFDTGQLQLEDRYTDLIRLGRVRLGLDAQLTELASIRLSGLLFSSDLADQPLTTATYADYAAFLRQHWLGAASTWGRPFLLEDAQFTLGDPRVSGTLIVGQQWLPFGYTDAETIVPPLTIAPQATPMSEYINALRLNNGLVPWQLSAATRQRQVGATLRWLQAPWRITSGVYTGAGPNQADNNGSLDWLARLDYVSDLAELGLSFLRGDEPGFHAMTAAAVPYTHTVFGAHVHLPDNLWLLSGEYLFGFDDWQDQTSSSYWGGYLTLGVRPDQLSRAYLQGAYIQHSNPFDGALTGFGSLTSRQLTLGYSRQIVSFARLQDDLSYTWEDLAGDRPTGIGYWQDTARLVISF